VTLPNITMPVAATVTVGGSAVAPTLPGADLGQSFTNNTGAHGAAALISGGRVDATLPPSTTMTVIGPSVAQSAAGTQSFFAAGISNQVGGGAGAVALTNSVALFTGSRAAGVTIDTRWVTPTAAVVSGSPIVITGSTNGGTQQSALMIDGRGLPSGSQINLDNVDFAALIGNMTVVGGAGQNFVAGDDAQQFISLGADDDTLYGGGGDDTVGSAGGADLLFGDNGNDVMSGGTGADSLFGGNDNDLIYGNQDLDLISAGDGNDTVFAGQNTGAVRVSDDGLLRQLDGIETIFGGGGSDLLYGNYGAEVVYGEIGNDTLYGGQGDDTMLGGAGADVLAGNRANDHLFGGAGADVFVFTNNGAVDVVHDLNLAEGDKIRIAANINGTGVATAADLLARIGVDATGTTFVDLGGGNAVQIVGVAPIQLTTSAFEIG
jgi:Ca2+-binding RTX toxin-like protein